MIKKTFAIAIILIILFSFFPITTSQAVTEDEVYEWNKKVLESFPTDDNALAFFLLPSYNFRHAPYTGIDDVDNQDIINMANEITKGLTSDYEKAKAIHIWVSSNLWYDLDYESAWYNPSFTKEEWYDTVNAVNVIETRRTICGGFVNLAIALLRASDIPAETIWFRWLNAGIGRGTFPDKSGLTISDFQCPEKSGRYTVMAVAAYVDGKWIVLDPGMDSINTGRVGNLPQLKPGNFNYFDLSLEALAKDRVLQDYITEIPLLWADRSASEIIVPNGILAIEDYLFDSWANLIKITIPGSVRSIGEGAFSNCTSLSTVIMNEGLEIIGGWAFASCISLEEIIFPDTVTEIGQAALAWCTNLKKVYIPPSVTFIADYNFHNGNPDVTIYGKAGSYAETYARDNNIPFAIWIDEVIVEPEPEPLTVTEPTTEPEPISEPVLTPEPVLELIPESIPDTNWIIIIGIVIIVVIGAVAFVFIVIKRKKVN